MLFHIVLRSASMPRRRVLLATVLTSLLAGCEAEGPPAATWVGRDATYPDPSGSPSASTGTTAGPTPCPTVPAGVRSAGGGAGVGPAGSQRLTGSASIHGGTLRVMRG